MTTVDALGTLIEISQGTGCPPNAFQGANMDIAGDINLCKESIASWPAATSSFILRTLCGRWEPA